MPLSSSAVEHSLAPPDRNEIRVAAQSIKHPLLKPVVFDDRQGLTPDQAAILAVLANPSLRAVRDQRQVAAAQLLQAGILPNPQVSFGEEYPYGGAIQGAVTASDVGLSWDVTQLISHDAKVRAAQAGAASVDLSIAWQEWQIAQAAKTAVYDVVSLEAQLALARDIDRHLSQNLAIVRQAFDRHDKTLLDLTAAEAASLDAHVAVLAQQRDLQDQRLTLNKTLGVPPEARVKLKSNIVFPDHVSALPANQILNGLESRRLDLLALKLGYQNQEQTLRAAVLEQFPRINIGFDRQRDNTNVQSVGFAVTVDLPIFDRNQGSIAVETATRQRLFDEYIQRVYEARFDVYSAIDDLSAISRQIVAAEAGAVTGRQLIDTYRDALNQGNVDVLSYYTAISSLTQKQLDILKLKQQLMDNEIALELAAGEYFPAPTN
ncbi:MAG TPA: TolC family protein [Tepidisphaeraceae bacterium]|jgi:outer membrane protein TolC|nr:TolC family protein [Tepidisphaeraceae bacterium]